MGLANEPLVGKLDLHTYKVIGLLVKWSTPAARLTAQTSSTSLDHVVFPLQQHSNTTVLIQQDFTFSIIVINICS